MKMRIAILAACAGTLALAQVDVARANYGPATGAPLGAEKMLAEGRPAGVIVVAENNPGQELSSVNFPSLKKNANGKQQPKAGSDLPKTGDKENVSTTRRRVLPKTGTTKSSIFVRGAQPVIVNNKK